MRRQLAPTAVLVSLVLVASEAAAACEPAVQASRSPPYPYGPRGNGSYCEGTFALNVASNFQLVSLTIGAIPYQAGVQALQLSTPLSPAGITTSIRARSYSTTTGYQLDATLRSPDSFTWRMSDVIGRLGLGVRNFGVFGYRRQGPAITYVPVAAARPGTGPTSNVVVVTAIAPEHLRGIVEYQIVRPGADAPWQTAIGRDVNRGMPVYVRLPRSEFDSPFQLRLRATSRLDANRQVRLNMQLGV